jgi:nitroimidazol reductase NimA-like FMN-containing flavoprotein (pyridoxamine 5'-phosphate oxidase superfamily)
MADFPKNDTTRIRRLPDRGAYDKETIYQIVDEALICHVGFVQDERPFVIPTLIARDGDAILLHGASSSRMMRHIAAGESVCITTTHVDGLVLARSVFHHSVNYRSALLFGSGSLLEGKEKFAAMANFTNKLIPGRWDDARQPNKNEMKATAVVAIPIDMASAKVRVGPPGDDEEDYALDVWAGVLPIAQRFLTPQDDPRLKPGITVPNYIREYIGHE